MNAFKTQQARWAKGLMQTAKKILPRLLRADLPGAVKAEAFFHLTANVTYPLMVVFSALLLPAMIVRFYQGWFQMLLIDLRFSWRRAVRSPAFTCRRSARSIPRAGFAAFSICRSSLAVGIGLSVRQCQGSSRSYLRPPVGVCAHAEIQYCGPVGFVAIETLPQPRRLDSLRGGGTRALFLGRNLVRDSERKLRDGCRFCSCLCGLPLLPA